MNAAAERLQMELSLYGIETISIQERKGVPGYVTATINMPSNTSISGKLQCIKDGKRKLVRSPDTLNDREIQIIADYNNPQGERYVADDIDKAYYHLPDLLHDLGLMPSTKN